MIIESLNNLHRSLVSDGVLPAIGFERRKLRFIIELAADGSCLGVTDCSVFDVRRMRNAWFNLPVAVRRTSRIRPNLLWDNLEYALGMVLRHPASKAYRQAVERRHLAFCVSLRSFADTLGNDAGLQATLNFYASESHQEDAKALIVAQHDLSAATLSFRLHGDEELVAERDGLRDAIIDTYFGSRIEGQCLVTGASSQLARTHGLVKGLSGGHATGTSLVSFNLGAARSYGMERGEAAPISQAAAAGYVCALNWLLRPINRKSLQIGRLTLVFWEDVVGSPKDEPLSNAPPTNFTTPGSEKHEDILIDRVLTAIRTATQVNGRTADLCVLGLVPNVARAAVVFWRRSSSIDLLRSIERWTNDLDLMCGSLRAGVFLTTTNILQALRTSDGNSGHRETQIATTLVQAAFFGERVRADMLAIALRALRLQLQESARFIVTCLVKMILIRNYEVAIPAELDSDIQDVPYRLGRLFAVLEQLQSLAYPKVASTVHDRFWASSSASPMIGFRIPLRMARIYLRKLSPRPQAFFEKVLEEVVSEIPVACLPARLSLAEQGLFAVGYYHQRNVLAGWAKR